MICLECQGVRVTLFAWVPEIEDAANRNMRFSSPLVMFEWLGDVFPGWRKFGRVT